MKSRWETFARCWQDLIVFCMRPPPNRKQKILKYAPTRINYLTYSTLFIFLDFTVFGVCVCIVFVALVGSYVHTFLLHTHTNRQKDLYIHRLSVPVRKILCKSKYLLWFGCITKNFYFIFACVCFFCSLLAYFKCWVVKCSFLILFGRVCTTCRSLPLLP